MAAEELGESALAQALGRQRGGIAGQEGEGDRGIDVGEDAGGAGPEPLEQGPKLIGQGHALGDEVVAPADEGAQGARVVGGRAERPEAMAIGAKEIGEEVAVAVIALPLGSGIPGPAGFDDVGVDGDDLEAGVHQRVDDDARGALDGDPQGGGGPERPEAPHEVGQAGGRMRRRAAPVDGPGVVQHTDGVCGRGPVDADKEGHCAPPWDCETLREERSCRSLTDWRSGVRILALHPVAGRGLSSPDSGERVSSWPSSGERPWLSPNPPRRTSALLQPVRPIAIAVREWAGERPGPSSSSPSWPPPSCSWRCSTSCPSPSTS